MTQAIAPTWPSSIPQASGFSEGDYEYQDNTSNRQLGEWATSTVQYIQKLWARTPSAESRSTLEFNVQVEFTPGCCKSILSDAARSCSQSASRVLLPLMDRSAALWRTTDSLVPLWGSIKEW